MPSLIFRTSLAALAIEKAALPTETIYTSFPILRSVSAFFTPSSGRQDAIALRQIVFASFNSDFDMVQFVLIDSEDIAVEDDGLIPSCTLLAEGTGVSVAFDILPVKHLTVLLHTVT